MKSIEKHLYLSEETAALLSEFSRTERRSLSSLADEILSRELRRRGLKVYETLRAVPRQNGS